MSIKTNTQNDNATDTESSIATAKTSQKKGGDKARKRNAKKKAKAMKKTSEKKKKEPSKFKYLTGVLFAKMMRGGASELRANADEVNKLNVFPVPDGDTGDNMSMTIDSGIAALGDTKTNNLAEVMHTVSKGMLLGARGNSGVILSQFFAGIAKGFENTYKADPKVLGAALKLGVEQAYLSVMTPTEGTILTVMREAVDYAVSRINEKSTIRSLFSDLTGEMNASLARTPELLPVLREAGVVDSGGAGLYYIIDGLNKVLGGESLPELKEELPTKSVNTQATYAFGPDSVMTYGYCTEFLLQLQRSKTDIDSFDIDGLKGFLCEVGDSVVAFITDSIVKVHVHTKTPEVVLAYARKYGEFLTVKIENMSVQHTENKAENETASKPVEKKKYSTVAVSCGPGIDAIFKELGADVIITGGQSNNPSTNNFINAFESINAEHIFVFPNNGNIVMAANQAAEIYTEAKVHVIATKSTGAGYVALSSIDTECENAEKIVEAANDAIKNITSAYISPAARDADMNGIHIAEGDIIGVVDKKIVVSKETLSEATNTLIDTVVEENDPFMITVFCGVDASDSDRESLESHIKSSHPGIELYILNGGQEIYPFIFIFE